MDRDVVKDTDANMDKDADKNADKDADENAGKDAVILGCRRTAEVQMKT